MAKFLNTTATNYHLEELIKRARDRLVLISPFLKLNERMKELLQDKDRLKIDVRIVYGKSELAPAEIEWLKGLRFVRTSFCRNLHAKCYLSEEGCIVTSLNLYEFSMINNNEMGVLISRGDDPDLYRDAYDETQRIIRISEEVRISLERVEPPSVVQDEAATAEAKGDVQALEKLTTAKLAAKLGMATKSLQEAMVNDGVLELKGERHYLTAKGKDKGGEWRPGMGGGYMLWPSSFELGR